MRTRILVAMLLVSFGTCAFAANKNVKPSPSSTGRLITSAFNFSILGDGISTTFTINPYRIPQNTGQGVAALPFLPLVGVFSGGLNQCSSFGTEIFFTGTVSGREVAITLATPPDAGSTFNCSTTLLFHPE
jgi:hypothetical protein